MFPVKAFSDPESWDNFVKPVSSCIHFGGEAFDEKYSGYVQGAFCSGIKVAQDVIKLIQK